MPGQGFQFVAQVTAQANRSSISAVRNELERALKGMVAPIEVRVPSGAASGLNAITSASIQLQKNLLAVEQQAMRTSSALSGMTSLSGRGGLGQAALQVGGVLALGAAIRSGVRDAIAFDRELNKLGQLGASQVSIKRVSDEITRLSTNLGVSSKDLASASISFTQAGLSGKELEAALRAVAKASLAPAFGSMEQAVTGSIAALKSFDVDAKNLEGTLGSLNALSQNYRVTVSDLLAGVERSGSVFHAANGSLTEFASMLAVVRGQTQESASEIATGLRTIFTRLQRPQTLEALHQLGIELRYTRGEAEALGNTKLAGQFVGPMESLSRLRAGMGGLQSTDPRFSHIEELIGGYRQSQRLVPLLQQSAEVQKAYQVATLGSNSLTGAAAQAQSALSVELTKTKEAWSSLLREVTNNRGLRSLVEDLAGLTKNVLELSHHLAPLVPLLGGLGALKLGRSLYGRFAGGASAPVAAAPALAAFAPISLPVISTPFSPGTASPVSGVPLSQGLGLPIRHGPPPTGQGMGLGLGLGAPWVVPQPPFKLGPEIPSAARIGGNFFNQVVNPTVPFRLQPAVRTTEELARLSASERQAMLEAYASIAPGPGWLARGARGLGRGARGLWGRVTAGGGIVGGSIGASVLGGEVEGFAGEASDAVLSGRTASFRGLRAGGATLTGAGTGGALGFMVGGPWGAAVGGVIGGLYSLTTSLRQAARDISEAKLSNALSGPLTAENLLAARAEIGNAANEKSTHWYNPFVVDKDLKSQFVQSGLSSAFGPKLPQMQEALNKIVTDTVSANPNASLSDQLKRVKNLQDPNSLNYQLIRAIQDARNISPQEMSKEIAAQVMQTRRGNAASAATGLAANDFFSFAPASQSAAGSAALAYAAAHRQTSFLGFGPDLPSIAAGGLAAPFGARGAGLAAQGTALAKMNEALPGILASVISNRGMGPEEQGNQLEDRLRSHFGGKTSPELGRLIGLSASGLSAMKPEDVARRSFDPRGLAQDLIKDISGPFHAVAEQLAKSFSEEANRFISALSEGNRMLHATVAAQHEAATVGLGGARFRAERMAEAAGRRGAGLDFLSLAQLESPFARRQEGIGEQLGLRGRGAFNPQILGGILAGANRRLPGAITAQTEAIEKFGLQSPEATKAMQGVADLQRQAAFAANGLANLSNVAERGAGIHEKLNRLESDRQSRAAFGESYLSQDISGRLQTMQGLSLVGMSAKAGGSLNGFAPFLQATILKTLSGLGDTTLTLPGGIGRISARDYKEQLLSRAGFVPDKQAAGERGDLLARMGQYFGAAEQASKLQFENQKTQTADFFRQLAAAHASFLENLSAKLPGAGAVHKAAGGSIFQPSGSDVVPAMLTPGEFVVKASAASKHRGLLESINSGSMAFGPDWPTSHSGMGEVLGGKTRPVHLAGGGDVLSAVRKAQSGRRLNAREANALRMGIMTGEAQMNLAAMGALRNARPIPRPLRFDTGERTMFSGGQRSGGVLDGGNMGMGASRFVQFQGAAVPGNDEIAAWKMARAAQENNEQPGVFQRWRQERDQKRAAEVRDPEFGGDTLSDWRREKANRPAGDEIAAWRAQKAQQAEGFAEGGSVSFGGHAAALTQALEGIPDSIHHEGNHQVFHHFNGLEGLTSLQGPLKEMMDSRISDAISKTLKNKLPDVA